MVSVSPLATGTFSYDTGTGTATVTAPAGCWICLWSCAVAAGGSAGSVTITPKGGAQTETAGPPIVVPAGAAMSRDWPNGGPLGSGTVIAFAGTSTYYVEYSKGSAQ